MAHPKRKTSHSKKRMRRSHHALSAKTIAECDHCGEIILPHRVCGECGYYNGRQIIKTETHDHDHDHDHD